LTIQRGTDIHLNCGGREIKSYSEKGVARVEPQAALNLEHCNWDSFNGAVAQSTPFNAVPGMHLEADADLQLSHSYIRVPCTPDKVLSRFFLCEKQDSIA
jgi:hypothetical protein